MLKKFLITEKNEHIIAYVRKHWLVMLTEGIFLFILAFLPFLILIITTYQINILISLKVFTLGLFFYFIWLIFIWILFFLAWTDNYLDVWIITNKRIIGIDQKGIFNREITSLRLERIQDTTVSIKGFLPTILSLGDLHVQTAGTDIEIIFKNAANPYAAKKSINRLQDQSFTKEKK